MDSLKNSGNAAAYHALFQAEVNLRKALELYKKGPVNGDKKPTKRGILTERQRKWVSRKPNESHIENPVLYKYKKLQKNRTLSGSELTDDVEAVKDLHSDEREPDNMQTGIVDRIQTNRKERHEACLEEMFQELGIISLEIEPRVMDASKIVKEYLDEDLKEINQELEKLQNDCDLICLNYEDLQTLWQNVTDHSKVRQSWIEQLGITLHEYEDQRSILIKEVFNDYTRALLRIAHLMPPDVHRLMEKESLSVNISLLKNRRSCADLIRRLITADIERERQHYLYWEEKVEHWRELRVQDAISGFETFMASPSVADPANVKTVMDSFVAEQRSLNKRRLGLLAQFKDIKPPNATRVAVQSLHQTFIQMTEDLDKSNARYRDLIRIQQEKVIQKCENELERAKAKIFKQGIASEEELEQIATDYLFPLLGEKKSCFQYDLDKTEKDIENETAEQKQRFQALFSFVQGLAHYWDAHEVGLSKEERDLKERLHKVRKEHDGQNQVREAKLDIVMDRLRQDSTENALASSLKEALLMLGEIKKSLKLKVRERATYHHFHGLQVKTAQEYPDMIAEELQRYEENLLNYLGVSRNQVKRGSSVSVSKSKESLISWDETEKTKKVKSTTSQDNFLQTKSGKKFWILHDSPASAYFKQSSFTDPSLKTNYTFLTENQGAEIEIMPYVEGFHIPFEILLEIQLTVREKFLDHLDTWKEELMIKAESVVQAKIEEINNELDLRLHLHEPRPTRAERDVHNVRAAELISHRERISEHCQGVSNELNKLKAQFTAMVDDQRQEAEHFKQSVEGLEHDFGKAAKSHELTAVQDLVSGKLENYMTIVRATIRKFRQELDSRAKEIRESNTWCRKSLRTFSEGGNFSTEEIEEYRKKLEKIASKIDNTEGHMMGDLEGMETKRLETAQDVAGKLEEKFKFHLLDLTFIEKISRWLTNVQLRIKSEVAKSNSHAQKIAKAIATFDRRIDAVKMPNVDKEQLTAKDLHETFMPIIDTFHSRVQYLNCGINDIAMINLKSLKTDFQRESSEVVSREITASPKRSRKGKRKGRQGSGTYAPNRAKSSESRKTESGSGSVLKVRLALSENPPVESPVEVEANHPTTASRRKDSISKTKHGGKYDKKYLIFEQDEPIPDNFNGRIQLVLRDCLDGMLTTAEFYYRQKGARQPTRIGAINENFDQCAEAFINRLRSYQRQTEEYHNSCIQEFRAQIKKFESSLLVFPSLVINEFYKEFLSKVKSYRLSMKESFSKQMESLERRKREYYTLLRPTLGHPKNKADREKLCEQEEKRRHEMQQFIQEIKAQVKAQEETFASDFVGQLNALVLNMVREFDTVLTTDDVVVGTVKTLKKSQKQMIREQLTQSEGSVEEKTDISVGPRTWPSLSVDLISQLNGDGNSNQTEEVKSRRCLAAHEAVIKARNEAFEIYLSENIKATESLESETEKLTGEELRWKDNWDRSLSKILDLY